MPGACTVVRRVTYDLTVLNRIGGKPGAVWSSIVSPCFAVVVQNATVLLLNGRLWM